MCKLEDNQCLVANTDGIICSKPIPDDILNEWQTRTGFKLTCKKYKFLILKDVNSYYALGEDGSVKSTSAFKSPSWTHNVRSPILAHAVVNLFLNNLPIEESIYKCRDLYYFCFFTKVKKGDNKTLLLDGEPIEDPKIRYYIANEGHILERQSEKVTSRLCKDSAIKLAMNLTPIDENTDINYNWYIKEADKIVQRIIGSSSIDRNTGTDSIC